MTTCTFGLAQICNFNKLKVYETNPAQIRTLMEWLCRRLSNATVLLRDFLNIFAKTESKSLKLQLTSRWNRKLCSLTFALVMCQTFADMSTYYWIDVNIKFPSSLNQQGFMCLFCTYKQLPTISISFYLLKHERNKCPSTFLFT